MANKDQAFDRALGVRVRFARIEKRMSQGGLAEQLGISFQQVQKYELGKDRISASMLFKIAKTFALPTSYFYEDMGDPGDAGPQLADIVDRRGKDRAATSQNFKMIRALARVPDGDVKRRVMSLIVALGAAEAEPAGAEAPAPLPQAAE